MNKNNNIIVLSGKKGVGKDTIANMISNYQINAVMNMGVPFEKIELYTKLSFAKPIKEILSIVAREEVHTLDDFKDLSFLKREGSNLSTDKTPRDLYKDIADLFKKSLNDDIWVDILLDKLNEHKKAIITDMRFQNEYKALKELNPIFVRVKRTLRYDPSKSEVDLDSFDDSYFDYIIENNGSEKELFIKVEEFCKKFNVL